MPWPVLSGRVNTVWETGRDRTRLGTACPLNDNEAANLSFDVAQDGELAEP